MNEGIRPGVWSQNQHKTPEAALVAKQEKEEFSQFANRFDSQAEQALTNMLLVGSIKARVREIDAAFAEAMTGNDNGTLQKICSEIARQNPKAFPDTLDDTPNSKERAAYVLALANKMSEQLATLH